MQGYTWASEAVIVIGMVGCAAANAQHQPPPNDLKTAPLIRGTLWWIDYPTVQNWDKPRFELEIQTQKDVGFDVLWLLNTPALVNEAIKAEEAGHAHDPLGMILDIAAQKDMHAIIDLPQGGWYGKTSADAIIKVAADYVRLIRTRYGKHPALWGWYLNYEINPIKPGDTEESAFWRKVWREEVTLCHETIPNSKVTISPFFLLDSERLRGFVYLSPEQYGDWWGKTLKETGIDILMLQDSGEHLSFFTLEQRRPFFRAAMKACHEAGAQFWVNVETGEAHVANWDEASAVDPARPGNDKWRFTPMDWLDQKLRLAATYGDSIINWGYYPFMDPLPWDDPKKADGQAAYKAYKAYYERMLRAGAAIPPLKH